MADQAWTFQYVEFSPDQELRIRATGRGEPDRGKASGARCYGLRRPRHEFDVDARPMAAAYAELRSIGDRPLGAEVEGSAPTSLIDRK